jgi:hypothetical protein
MTHLRLASFLDDADFASFWTILDDAEFASFWQKKKKTFPHTQTSTHTPNHAPASLLK